GPLPRVLAAVGSAGAAAVILAGAVLSAWRARRSGADRRLLWSNSLIAAGTLILGASGTLNSVFGAMTAFAVTLLAGIVVIFAGFVLATSGGGAVAVALEPAALWRPPATIKAFAATGAGPSRPAHEEAKARS
ncbi:MAG: hypothetical protein M3N98_05875, partial [Actinomycetota bacterium]|nr:hypothetical protein [Actinomycetota bacterium]